MRIYASKIPPEGLVLAHTYKPAELELGAEGMEFIKPVKADAKVQKTGNEVFIDLELRAPVGYTCARCLAKFEGEIFKKLDLYYKAKPDDIIDITDELRQEIIIDYPMKVLCKEDCEGLCPNCGQNLNVGKCDCA